MKRTTVLLPDDLAYLLDRERRRRGVSTAAIVREAVAAHLGISDKPRRLGFASLGRSGRTDIGENFERYLDEEWGSEGFFNRTMGRYPDAEPGKYPIRDASSDRGSDDAGTAPVNETMLADDNVDVTAKGD